MKAARKPRLPRLLEATPPATAPPPGGPPPSPLTVGGGRASGTAVVAAILWRCSVGGAGQASDGGAGVKRSPVARPSPQTKPSVRTRRAPLGERERRPGLGGGRFPAAAGGLTKAERGGDRPGRRAGRGGRFVSLCGARGACGARGGPPGSGSDSADSSLARRALRWRLSGVEERPHGVGEELV